MGLAALQHGDEVLAQSLIVIYGFAFFLAAGLLFFFTIVSCFSESSSFRGEYGSASYVVFTVPVFPNIFSYCEKV